MTRLIPGILPVLPKEGDQVAIFGIVAEVLAVTPQSDWSWYIELRSASGGGGYETWHMVIPTDYATDNNRYAFG